MGIIVRVLGQHAYPDPKLPSAPEMEMELQSVRSVSGHFCTQEMRNGPPRTYKVL